ncbi:TraM recognition domain-containing protein [Sulfurimonas indica]|uniref:TraM recognition domain-containing protein n=1 Tax=Sulfurimonas TaxID=202746 RepID=UPI001264C88B|nr:TraM recognition domain-containing protein [Sulfurimonas indica]
MKKIKNLFPYLKNKFQSNQNETDNALLGMAKKIKVKSSSLKDRVEKYKKYRKDLKTVIADIKKLEEEFDDHKDLKAFKAHKKELESYILEIEQTFYDDKKGLWLGMAVDLKDVDSGTFLLYLEWGKLHNHFVVYGTSGFGKSRLFAIIMRQMIAHGWNVFAVDPKVGAEQEIARWMYEFALQEGCNNSVMRITASHPDLSDRLNPIFGMDDEEIAAACRSLSSSGAGVESASEKYFSGQVYRIAFAILKSMRFLEKVTYYGHEDDLVSKIISEAENYMKFKEMADLEVDYEDDDFSIPDISSISLEQIIKKRDVKIDISPFDRTLVTFKELAYFGQFAHLEELAELVNVYPIPKISEKKDLQELKRLKLEATEQIKPLIAMGNDRYSAVGDTFSTIIGQLAFGNIGKIFTSTRINPLRIKLKTDRVLTILEPAPLRFEAVSEMMIKIFIRMFISMFGEIGASGRGLENRSACLIDEAKPMAFPGIEELYNKARSLGMTLGAFYQSTSDPKLKLGETLADIVDDNTATKIYMKQDSLSSRVEAAESLGSVKVAVNIHMSDVDVAGGGRNTIIHEDRVVATAEHIDELQIGEAYIKHYGKKYFVKFPYQSDPDDSIQIEMPELETETIMNQLKEINDNIMMQMQNIKNMNFEDESGA